MKNIGIDAISFDVPKIYVDIKDLAELRGIEAAKLELGLGLKKMAFPDAHQDVVVFAANAVRKLIRQEKLKTEDIDRIYLTIIKESHTGDCYYNNFNTDGFKLICSSFDEHGCLVDFLAF